MRVVRDHATPEAEGGRGNHTVRHREVSMDASEEAGVTRQLDVERDHFEARVLKGSQLRQRLGSAPFLAYRIRHLRDHDGRNDPPTFPPKRGQLRPGPREDLFVVIDVVSEKERGV